MALRVLLADESVTIKKVIQLALQDFAVEVKAVPVGLDVLEVSKSFQPDLVFADILLQKRSGYEVCADLKKDGATAAIPVVLMWSSFMELDQRQVDACGADGRLEKPFEVEALRKLVLELVPRTRSQRMAHFLEYPATMAAPLKNEIKPPPPVAERREPSAPLQKARPQAKTPASNPFASSLGSGTKVPQPESSIPTGTITPATEFQGTPGIPDRPVSAEPPPRIPDAPLGALPDLQLEGQTGPGSAPASPAGGWNMDSFEPLDLAPLNLTDDEDEDESFKPLQLPQAEPAASGLSFPMGANTAALSLADDKDDADQWANQSLDKYRLAPLKPDESLAIDDLSADFAANHESIDLPLQKDNLTPSEISPSNGSITQPLPQVTAQTRGNFQFNQKESLDLATDKTEVIQPNTPRNRQPESFLQDDDVPEFAMTDDDFNRTSRLEIETVDLEDKTRPAIVRELMREPDYTEGGRTQVSDDGAFDLSKEGKPSSDTVDSRRMEDLVRTQLTPQLEKIIEKVIERTVSQLLPQIAERIIKKELERLLEETQ